MVIHKHILRRGQYTPTELVTMVMWYINVSLGEGFLSFNNLFSNNKICSNQVTMVIHKHIIILLGRWRGYNYDHNAMPMQLSPLFRGHSVTMRLWVTGGWRSLEVKGQWRFEVTGG